MGKAGKGESDLRRFIQVRAPAHRGHVHRRAAKASAAGPRPRRGVSWGVTPTCRPPQPHSSRTLCMPACCRPAACTLPSAPRRTIARQVDTHGGIHGGIAAQPPTGFRSKSGASDDDVLYLFLQNQKLAQRYTPIGYSQFTEPRSPLRRDVGMRPGSSNTSPTMSCQTLRQRSGRAWFSPCARSAHGSWFSSPASRRCCAHPVRQRTEGKWNRC